MIRLAIIPLLCALALPALAQPDAAAVRHSIVQIVVLSSDGEVLRLGSGLAIADGHVLTAAHLVANEDRIVVVPLTTGAELVARIVHADSRADIVVLAVNGLMLPPLKLAQDGFAPGRLVYSVGVWNDADEPPIVAAAAVDVELALAEGAVGRRHDWSAEENAATAPLLEHNAMMPAAGYGGPLLNECGEVAGMNRGAPGVAARRLRRGQGPEGVAHAVPASAIAELLAAAGLAAAQSDTTCAEGRAAAEARAAEAEAQAQTARAEAEANAGEVEQTREELEQANVRVSEAEARESELQARLAEAERTGAAEAHALRRELEGARQEREGAANAAAALEARLAERAAADRRLLIGAVVAALAVITLIVVVAIAVHRRRTRELAHAQDEAARARQQTRTSTAASHFPDCLLTGRTSGGSPVSLKLPGSLLGDDGALIGRSPRNATFLIDDATLSREHARVFGDGDALYIEDMNTTNGTRLNGRALASGTPAAVKPGDAIELGGVRLELGPV